MLRYLNIVYSFCTAYHPETGEPFRVIMVREIGAGIWVGLYRPEDNDFCTGLFSEAVGLHMDPKTGDVYDIFDVEPGDLP